MKSSDINVHFKREPKVMLWFFLGPIIIGLLATLIIPNFIPQRNDKICIAEGGSFNYDLCKCDYKKVHTVKEKHQCN